MTTVTLWGDWGKQTDRAAAILTKIGMPYRIYLTRHTEDRGLVFHRCGDICGLDRIRAFADRVEQMAHNQCLFENL